MADKKKDATISIKLESAVIKRVEELTKTIEEKLAILTPKRLGEEFEKAMDDFRKLSEKINDLGRECDDVYGEYTSCLYEEYPSCLDRR